MLNNAIALIAVAALFAVEAIKVKERLPRFIFAGIALFFALWAFMVNQIADAWPKVGAFVTGTFSQPVSWFVLAVALFFVLRPFWHRGRINSAGETTLPALDHTETDRLRGELNQQAERLDRIGETLEAVTKLNASTNESLIKFIGELNDRTASLSESFWKALAEHKDHMSECYSAQDEARLKGLSHLNGEIEAIRGDCAGLQEKIDTLFMAFQAIRAIENEARLAGAIQFEGEYLTGRVNAKEPVKGMHWADWQTHHTTFESAMEQWAKIAQGWHLNVDKALGSVQPRDLTSKQGEEIDELFEGSSPVIIYKTFALKFERWKSFRSHLVTTLNIVAFGGPENGKLVRQGGLMAFLRGEVGQ
jgi:hypothetical protein